MRLDSNYSIESGRFISFQTLKFYISNIRFFQDGLLVYTEKNSFHLIDFEDINTKIISLDKADYKNFNQVKFDLGIDSTTNVSGAFGGDLDPTKGMYWTWQSGYINCKMEGKFTDFKKNTNDFEFHLGGYQHPFKSIQTVELMLNDKSDIHIFIDLANFAKGINLSNQKRIMSPCTEAVNISRQLAKCFLVR